jgi:hypothetical protein
MRPKIVLGLVLFAALFIGVAFLMKHSGQTKVPVALTTPPAPQAESASPPPMPAPLPATPPPKPLTDEERQAAIDAEVGHLQDWSMNDDPASLSNILADLASPEKEIREAAIEAAKQFGSTNAIPALKTAAVNSTNTDEQIEMLQAAEFLTLPSIRDLPPLTPEQKQALQEKQAQRAAQTQSRMQQQQGQQNQSTPPTTPSTGQN